MRDRALAGRPRRGRRGRRRPPRERASGRRAPRRAARARRSSGRCRAGSRAGCRPGIVTSTRAPSRSGERTSPTAPGGSPAASSAGRSTSSTSTVTVRSAAPPVRRTAVFRLFSSWPATSSATFGRASKFAPTVPIGMRRSLTRRPFGSVQAADLALERLDGGQSRDLLREPVDPAARRAAAGRACPRRASLGGGDVRRVRLEDPRTPLANERGRPFERRRDRASFRCGAARLASSASRSRSSRRLTLATCPTLDARRPRSTRSAHPPSASSEGEAPRGRRGRRRHPVQFELRLGRLERPRLVRDLCGDQPPVPLRESR